MFYIRSTILFQQSSLAAKLKQVVQMSSQKRSMKGKAPACVGTDGTRTSVETLDIPPRMRPRTHRHEVSLTDTDDANEGEYGAGFTKEMRASG